MRKILLFFLLLFAGIGMALAQAPQAIYYEGAVRDISGVPLSGQSVEVRLTIRNGGGGVEFQEIHRVTTNGSGLYKVEIGNGIPSQRSLSLVDWSSGNLQVDVEINPDGSGFLLSDSYQFTSVPYVFFAENVESVANDVDAQNLSIRTNGDTTFLEIDNGNFIIIPTGSACWDNNGNRGCDLASEDINNDGVCDILDCKGVAGPIGTAGAPGPTGSLGAAGPRGAAGSAGPVGIAGSTGPVGPTGGIIDCWDLNGNAICDAATEDLNGDSNCDVLDCKGTVGSTGSQGARGIAGPIGPIGSAGPTGLAGVQGVTGITGSQGAPGISGGECWDLNGNSTCDLATEDRNTDGACDVDDCHGLPGLNGATGPAGTAGALGPTGPAGGLMCWDSNGNSTCDLAAEDRNSDGVCDIDDCFGNTGAQGPSGATGLSGVDCWDVNSNSTCDPSEDINVDGSCNADDCLGVAGPTGPTGVRGAVGQGGGQNCWDLNNNSICDPATEDINKDNTCDALDCQGPDGSVGPRGSRGVAGGQGPSGSIGPTGPDGSAGGGGVQGPAGPIGPTGSMGVRGPTGPLSGMKCWDLNANGACDLATEDASGNGSCGREDCPGVLGPAGAAGPLGPSGPSGGAFACWDLNQNLSCDLATEDINNNGSCDIQDCRDTRRGIAGPTGQTGIAGAVGVAGIAGSVGSTGPTGAQGADGPTGPAGSQGAAGGVGPIGGAGPTGAAGPQGIQGTQGPQGNTGVQGVAGSQGVAGPAGNPGFQGPDGVTGPQGLAGSQGVVGPTGNLGVQGPDGVTGPQGVLGPIGAIGPTGIIGPGGTGGTTGPIGAAGPNGAPGATGAVGITGPRGVAGAAGANGSAGAAGPAGVTGPTGIAGPIGDSGPTGLLGPTGQGGTGGTTGPQGLQGIAGVTGPAGVIGPAGPLGATGMTGPQGYDCWDINKNGTNDPSEDINLDGSYDRADCIASGTGTPMANNGLNVAGASISTGGSLIRNTTVDQANFDLTYDMTGSGTFEVDAGSNSGLLVATNGGVSFGTTIAPPANGLRLGNGDFFNQAVPQDANTPTDPDTDIDAGFNCPAGAPTSQFNWTGNLIVGPANNNVIISQPLSGLNAYICDIHVRIDVTHTHIGDLDIILVTPWGQDITLSTGNGGDNTTGNAYVNCTFDDNATNSITTITPTTPGGGTYKPMDNLVAACLGNDPNGIWKLEVNDLLPLDQGIVRRFQLFLKVGNPIAPTWDLVGSSGMQYRNGSEVVVLTNYSADPIQSAGVNIMLTRSTTQNPPNPSSETILGYASDSPFDGETNKWISSNINMKDIQAPALADGTTYYYKLWRKGEVEGTAPNLQESWSIVPMLIKE